MIVIKSFIIYSFICIFFIFFSTISKAYYAEENEQNLREYIKNF